MSEAKSAPGAALPRWLQASAWLILILLLAKLLIFHWKLIHFPYPLDSHEPAQPILAQEFAAGRDLGNLDALPLYTNLYGPGYTELTGHLCRWGLACGLEGQRALSAILMGLLLLELGWVCLRLGAAWLESAAILTWVYALLLLNVTPIARPDSLANLLWFSGLALPFLFRYSRLSLLAASALFCLVFTTKVYYLIGPGMLGLWLLYADRRRFWFFLGAHLLLFSATLAWLLRSFPFTFYETVLLQANEMTLSRAYMLWQLFVVVIQASPGLLLLLPAGLAWGLRAERNPRKAGAGAWFFYAGFGLLLFVLYMGCNMGARLTYVVQLLMLPLAACLAVIAALAPRARLLVLACLLLSAWRAAAMADHGGFEPEGLTWHQWQAAEDMVKSASQPFAGGDLALTLRARGSRVYDTGLSKVFRHGMQVQGWRSKVFTRGAELQARCDAWMQEGRQGLLLPQTDYVFIEADNPLYQSEIMKAHFNYLGTIDLPYPQTGGGSEMGIFRNKNLKLPARR